MAHNNFRIYIITIAFIAIIIFPIINGILKIVNDIESSENRQMATKPGLNIKHLNPFPLRYEQYYNDYFTIRSLMVKCFNIINLMVFKKSPIPDKLVIGNHGWLFYGGNEIDSYRGINNFKDAELETFKLELEYRKKYLHDRGCKFYFLIAPVKTNIYSEEIPNTFFRFSKQSWGEKLIEYLNKNCEVKPINVYKVLRANKGEELLYYKLDNHWNQLGAFYAANEVLNRIHEDFPEIQKDLLENYKVAKTEIRTGNAVVMISNIDIYKDFFYELTPKAGFQAANAPLSGYPPIPNFPFNKNFEKVKEIKDSKRPKILIIADSFGDNIYPFIAEHFSRSVKIFDAWQYKLNEDIVNKEKPDIVLLMGLESNIRLLLEHQSRLSNNK